MVYITGDIHGDPYRIRKFCDKIGVTRQDTIIILGDVCVNYWLDKAPWNDEIAKLALSTCGATVLCVHGNHEARPATVKGYELKEWKGGKVWVQEGYPSLLFAKDGEVFNIEGKRYMPIGGAYSVDMPYRQHTGFWWPDEQPSDEIKTFVEAQLSQNKVDIILSHTCPYKYRPIEAMLPGLDQSTIDHSTEHWLGKIENSTDYEAWYCGHWHINKRIDKMHFLFDDFESPNQ